MSRFGSPLHKSFWINNESKNICSKPASTNFKNDIPISKKFIPLNSTYEKDYKYNWTKDTDSDDTNDSLFNISESDTELYNINKPPKKKKKNKRFDKNRNNSTRVLSDTKHILSKKSIDTLWKLYRNVGETTEDVKRRLVNLLTDETKINTECDSKKENAFEYDIIKNNIKKEEKYSDEDYKNNENEETNELLFISKEQKHIDMKKIVCQNSEFIDSDYNFDNFLCLDDILEVKIHESDEPIQFSDDINTADTK